MKTALSVSLVIFMVGNLLDMGLRLDVQRALKGLRDTRFVIQSLLWGFVLCPALAYGISHVLPLSPPYALGLVLLGMAPCAPFLPPMVERARGDLGYAAAFMVLASVATVVYMPIAVPRLTTGLTASAWAIAKPLVLFLLLPLAVGVSIQRAAPSLAAGVHPAVKAITAIDTLAMLALCLVIYGGEFVAAVGTYAIAAQVLFFAIGTAASSVLNPGLDRGQKTVLSLGMATRNLGAAFAPLFAAPDVDQRAIVMVALGVPMQTVAALVAATVLGRTAPTTAVDAAGSAAK